MALRNARSVTVRRISYGPCDGPPVVLLHGLARTHRAMRPMARYLARQGYAVVNLDYPSTRHPVAVLTAAVQQELRRHPALQTPVHFVTHSLGGILVRQLARNIGSPAMGRVVMLAPPNHGSEIVDALGDGFLFRWINGPAGQELGTDAASLPKALGSAGFDCGVIAGTRCRDPVCGPYIPLPSDGKVSVEATRLAGMSDHIRLSLGHTTIMRSRRTQAQTAHFLANGYFRRLPS